MGRYVLLVITAIALSLYFYNAKENTGVDPQSTRLRENVARQSARTGFNTILADARRLKKCPDQIVESISSLSGTYETSGTSQGTYTASLQSVEGQTAYRVVAKGTYPKNASPDQTETIRLTRLIDDLEPPEGLLYVDPGHVLRRTTPDDSDRFGRVSNAVEISTRSMDLDSDGLLEIPFVSDNGALILTDSTGSKQVLVPSGSPPSQLPAQDHTRFATGMWSSGHKSVFYPNRSNSSIYRAAIDSSGSPVIEEVRTVSNGVVAINGIDDIDGDSKMELVFVDENTDLRYIERPEGPISTLSTANVGMGTGIGAGPLVDFDRDGVASAVLVNSSVDRDLLIVDATGTNRTLPLGSGSSGNAEVVPPAAADLDGDNRLEIAYVRDDRSGNNPRIEYLDPDGSNVRPICGIEIDAGPGVRSLAARGRAAHRSGSNFNEWCASSDVAESDLESENVTENSNSGYTYSYEYTYTYEKGKYRYQYDYTYEYTNKANQDPNPSPNPPVGGDCGASNLNPVPSPSPNPSP